MTEREMPTGLMQLTQSNPLAAGLVGAALGLMASWSGQRVAHWSHLLGLRSSAGGGAGQVLGWSVASGLLSAALGSGGDEWWRPLGLGIVWGQAVMDFANNSRAAAALRAVAVDGPTLGAWMRLPPAARLGITASVGPAVTVVLAFAALLTLDPGTLGLLVGALGHVQWQRMASERALRAVEDPPAEADSEAGASSQ